MEIQKIEYLEDEKSFLGHTNSIFSLIGKAMKNLGLVGCNKINSGILVKVVIKDRCPWKQSTTNEKATIIVITSLLFLFL